MSRVLKMLTQRLGKSDIKVSAMGLGCLAIGGPWTHNGEYFHNGEVNDDESIRAIHKALELGINFFDTAANYGAGHSERLLGKAIAEQRDEVIIATKFGYYVNEETKSVRSYKNSDEVASYIRKDCETSLRRLNTDYIDLYQFHVNDYPVEKASVVRDVLEDLVSEGMIQGYGWSTNNLDSARVFAQGKHCMAIQHHLNVIQDFPEMLALCNEFNIASINRGPLGRGLLTGKYNINSKFGENDWRNSDYFRNVYMPPILGKIDSIKEILSSDGRTLVQGALAWIWARNGCTIPIPGFRTSAQVEENAKALEFGPLSIESMKQIAEILGRDPVT